MSRPDALALADALLTAPGAGSVTAYLDDAATELRRLHAEVEALKKAQSLLQQHHATAWNRGHTMGMMANRQIASEAMKAVAKDAWGNTQLTEALMAAEAAADALRKDAERYRWLRSVPTKFTAQAIVNDSPEGIDAAIDAARGIGATPAQAQQAAKDAAPMFDKAVNLAQALGYHWTGIGWLKNADAPAQAQQAAQVVALPDPPAFPVLASMAEQVRHAIDLHREGASTAQAIGVLEIVKQQLIQEQQ